MSKWLGHRATSVVSSSGGTITTRTLRPTTIFVASDTHYGTENSDYRNPNDRMIEAMLALPGTAHPYGGIINQPDAVFVTGDCVHDGLEPVTRFDNTFRKDGTGRIPWPCYYNNGNHDHDPFASLVIQRYGALDYGVKIGNVWFQFFRENFVNPGNTNPPSAAQINAVASEWGRPAGEPTVLIVHRAFGGYEVEWDAAAANALEALALSKNTLCILNGHNHYDRHETWRTFRVFSPGSVTMGKTGVDPDSPPYNTIYAEAFNVIRIFIDGGNSAYDVANYNFGFNLLRPLAGGTYGGTGWAPGTWNWVERVKYTP